jgi:hypothetical protein
MEIYHKIPKQRLEKEYLLNLMRGIGLSRYHTRMLGFKSWQGFLVLPLYMVNDLRKIVLHFIKYQKFYQTDVVYAVEMQLLVNTLLSPFYFWKNQLLGR